MKYIRTIDGIYERITVVRQVCDDKEVAVIRPAKVEFEPIINRADTIEELCDFAYALWEDKIFEVYDLTYDYIKLKDLSKWLAKGDVLEVYYGIKTDKGLIYVAKINEKGELELL